MSEMIRGGMDKDFATDDMLQDAREAAGKAVRTWDPAKGEFSTWVLGRVHYAVGDHIRRSASGMIGGRDSGVQTTEYFDLTPCNRDTGEQTFWRDIEVRATAHLLSVLHPQEQKILRLRFGFDGEPMSMREVAKVIEKPLRTTERIYKEVQKKLAGFVKKSR